MTIVNFTPLSALIGGALIGLAISLALLFNGKVAGMSGAYGRIFRRAPGDTLWRVIFVGGVIVGGAAIFALYPPAADFQPEASLPVMALAGLMVGIGTRVGGGCTSGHGVCGISRGSIRGLVATVTFMVVGMLTASIVGWMAG